MEEREVRDLVYGPVSSWRYGKSLGINVLGKTKRICTFSCIYCELGPFSIKEMKSLYCSERRVFVEREKILEEFIKFSNKDFDVITFSGAGEPSLAKNINEILLSLKKMVREKKFILLTNSSLLHLEDVRKEIMDFDIIDAKIDAISQELFKKMNRPIDDFNIQNILYGIKKLKEDFKGSLHIQIMVTHINLSEIPKIASFVNEIKPDEVQLNTPTRYPWKKPISKEILLPLKSLFKNLKVRTPYDFF